MNRYIVSWGTETYSHRHYATTAAEPLPIRSGVNAVTKTFVSQLGYTPLFQEKRFDPTKEDTEQLNEWLRAPERTADDLLVIYYTGHGELIGGTSPELRLILQDTQHGTELSTGLSPFFWKDAFAQSKVRHVWLILDVCHAGGATLDLGSVTRHLNSDIGISAATGKSVHLMLACRENQVSFVGMLPRAICQAVAGLQAADFHPNSVITHESFVRHVLNRAKAADTRQEVHPVGTSHFPAFISLENFKFPTGDHTDPSAHQPELTEMCLLLASESLCPLWLCGLLQPNMVHTACGRHFLNLEDLITWLCTLPVIEGFCPLVGLAVAVAHELGHFDALTNWAKEAAKWRGANFATTEARITAIATAWDEHSQKHATRIKILAEPVTIANGDGGYEDKVNLKVWHDFEDSAGTMARPQYRLDLATLGQEGQLPGLIEAILGQLPTTPQAVRIQFTLPRHLFSSPVESLRITEGTEQKYLHAVYPVIRTNWELDHGSTYHAIRQRRATKRDSLWRTSAQAPTLICMDAPKAELESDAGILAYGKTSTNSIHAAIDSGLPVVWLQQSLTATPAVEDWKNWPETLSRHQRHCSTDNPAILIWDDSHSTPPMLRHSPRPRPLRVPQRSA